MKTVSRSRAQEKFAELGEVWEAESETSQLLQTLNIPEGNTKI